MRTRMPTPSPGTLYIGAGGAAVLFRQEPAVRQDGRLPRASRAAAGVCGGRAREQGLVPALPRDAHGNDICIDIHI